MKRTTMMLVLTLSCAVSVSSTARAQFDLGGVLQGLADAAGPEIVRGGADQLFSEVAPSALRMLTDSAAGRGHYHVPYCDGRGSNPQPVQRPPQGSRAEQQFTLAQQNLRTRNYTQALLHADEAAKAVPKSHDVHQLRSLILLAQGRYNESADAAYRALAFGPGWNWKTLKMLMGSKQHYEQHYQLLQTAAKNNRESANLTFLLGYHCLMLGHLDAGGRLRSARPARRRR